MPLTQEQQEYLQEWYEQTAREVRANLREMNLRNWEEAREENDRDPNPHYLPKANLNPEIASQYIAEREAATKIHHSYIPLMADQDQALMQFLVQTSDTVAAEAAQAQLNVMIYQMMLDQTDRDPRRRELREEVRRLNLREQDHMMERAETWNEVDTILWKLEGRIDPKYQLVTEDEYNALSQDQKASGIYSPHRPYGIMEYVQNGPEEFRTMTFGDLLRTPPSVQRNPETLEMNFEENARFNSRKFLSNMSKKNPAPTPYQKDYAMSVFDNTFGGAFDKNQKKKLEDAGLSIYDMILIDGKSVKELYGEKYRNLSPERQEEMFKCEAVAAVMGSKLNVAFTRVVENVRKERVLAEPTAITRGGMLHDPEPTLGQRFLNFFHIKKYEPLSQKMAEANTRVQEARNEARASGLFVKLGEERLERQYNRIAMEKNMKMLSGAHYDQEYRQAFGVDFTGSQSDPEIGISGRILGTAMTRATTPVAMVYAYMLNQGHRLADIMDPDKLTEEKARVGRAIKAELGTPEGIGRVLAESTKAFANLDWSRELGYALGKDLSTPEAMQQALTGEKERVVALPMIKKIYSESREIHQAVNSLYRYNKFSLSEHMDEAAQEVMTEGMSEDHKKAFAALNANITTEDLQGRTNVDNFNKILMAGTRLNYMMDYLQSDAYVYGTDYTPAGNSLSDITEKAVVLQDTFSRMSMQTGETLGKVSLPFNGYYSKELKENHMEQFTDRQLTEYLRDGKRSAAAAQIEGALPDPAESRSLIERYQEENVTQFRENNAAKIREAVRQKSEERQAAAAAQARPEAAPVRVKSSMNELMEEEVAENGAKKEQPSRPRVRSVSVSREKQPENERSGEMVKKKDDELTRR